MELDDFWDELEITSKERKDVKEKDVKEKDVISIPSPVTPSLIEPIEPIAPIVIPTPTDAIETPVIKRKRFTPNDLPTVISSAPLPDEYRYLVESVEYGYSTLPKLEYDKIYYELHHDLSLRSEPTPDPQSINQQLDRIQAAKDRLEEIMSNVIQCYNCKKNMVDMLELTWYKYSTAKSADSRKSEAANLIANFTMDLTYVENLWRVCDIKFKHLEKQHDTVSRKITAMQICLKHLDIGRGMSPDFSFKAFSQKINNEENQSNVTINPSQGIDAVEQDFLGK